MRKGDRQGKGSGANPPITIRLRNDIPASVQRTGRRSIRELADGVDDPAPHRGTVVIALCGQLIRTCAAYLEGVVAVALEQELRRSPNVDLGYHTKEAIRFG